MRAKLVISNIQKHSEAGETLTFRAVCKEDGYDESGKDENSTFSLFTPSVDLTMLINNPDLLETYNIGDTFYVDFTKLEN